MSQWIEANIKLPSDVSSLPGDLRLWPYQVEIADAISDPLIERVSLIKAVRIGFTTLLTGAIGSFVANDPAPILCLLPTEADCRDYMVSDIEPIFDDSPATRGLLTPTEDGDTGERNTLLSRRFPGGSLKIVAARSPRNLRRHTARVLIIDEADAMETGTEGNPIRLAERRTMTFPNRKIIVGSTPVFEDTSQVLRAYGASDGRVFEVPCPECGAFNEIMWGDIVWPEGNPEEAAYRCPHCEAIVQERFKAEMVRNGRWRATRPDVKGHAGFRINALVSLTANATWPQLAIEFIAAKDDPTELQTFVNTILGQGWSSPSMITDTALAARAEPFDLNDFPKEVLVLTAGADVQDDRIEVTICGWTRAGDCLILSHQVIWGSFVDASTWDEFEELLRTKWRHPLGGMMKIDAACVDASDGDHYDQVLNFCVPKANRRIFAIKGMFGARPSFAMAKGKKIANKLAIVGVDTLKSVIFDRLTRGRGIRFSNALEPIYYEQLASERRVIRYIRGQPARRFERVSSRTRAEALDALVYATAARSAVAVSYDRREAEVRGQEQPKTSIASKLAR